MKLRKVIFQLCHQDGFQPNLSQDKIKEEEELTKEREGIFHNWIPGIRHCPQTDNDIPCYNALIEEIETGELYEIDFDLFRFVVPYEYVQL